MGMRQSLGTKTTNVAAGGTASIEFTNVLPGSILTLLVKKSSGDGTLSLSSLTIGDSSTASQSYITDFTSGANIVIGGTVSNLTSTAVLLAVAIPGPKYLKLTFASAGNTAVASVTAACVDVPLTKSEIHADLVTADVTTLVNAMRLNVLGDSVVTVDATAGGKTLETLLGTALQANLERLTLIPSSPGIYRSLGGTPSITTGQVPAVFQVDITKSVADTYKFITGTGSITMQVIQEG